MDASAEIKNQILDAATTRICQYGCNKTTMAEIGKDCGMSAGNIYRFFDGKKEILAEIANHCLRQIEDALRAVLRRPGLRATERLEAFTLETLRSVYGMCASRPRISETVELISDERADLVARHQEVKQSLITEILAEGNRSGEFDVEDVVATAGLILVATSFFASPVFMGKTPLEELEQEAKGLTKLLVRGLGGR
jgi:AcrR family transcriptional regulator